MKLPSLRARVALALLLSPAVAAALADGPPSERRGGPRGLRKDVRATPGGNGNVTPGGNGKGRVASHDCTVQIAALLYDAALHGDAPPADFEDEVFECAMDRLDTFVDDDSAGGGGGNGTNNGNGSNGSGGNNGNNHGKRGPPATRRLGLTAAQKSELKQLWHAGELVPNESKLQLKKMKQNGKGVEFDDRVVNLPPGLAMKDAIALSVAPGDVVEEERPPKPAEGAVAEEVVRKRRDLGGDGVEHETAADDNRRHLQIYDIDAFPYGKRVGVTPILVVKVFDSQNRAITLTPDQVSCNVFGPSVAGTSCDDIDHLKSSLEGCSMGRMTVQAGVPQDESSYKAPGVIEVDIGVDLTAVTTRYDVQDAVTDAVEEELGISFPGPYKHVMYLLENCYVDCGWAAYANVNGPLSVYKRDRYARSNPVQVHELGHNFNLLHSGGLDEKKYTDHTGYMGNPYYTDDDNKMCFNSAKSWQIGWYNDRKVVIDPTTKGSNWSTTIKLVGLADYGTPAARSLPVVLKLETGSSLDYYINFNRQAGINANVDQFGDLLTIVTTGANGEGRSQSYLKAGLAKGEVYQYLRNGVDIFVSVLDIDLSSQPGIATIAVGRDQTPSVPGPQPCPAGTVPLRVDIIADKYPGDISWTLTNDCTETTEASRTNFPYGTFSYSDDNCVSPSRYTFRIDDEFGDGLARGNGIGSINGFGSYTVVYGGSAVATGGDFGSSESTTFGSCTETDEPTKNPTRKPTIEPTKNPTRKPTKAPTAPPTNKPTSPCPGEMEVVVTIQTDDYPLDTSYSLTNDCESSAFTPIEFNADPDAENALYDDTYCVPMGQYTFVLTDSWGDGLCCKYGDGFYNVTVDGIVEASGGEFTNDGAGTNVPAFQKATFGSCGPSVSPTTSPTPSPTADPTNSPSARPTSVSPTASPSATPTSPPTRSPTASPSQGSPKDPLSISPTRGPTTSPSNAPSPPPSLGPGQPTKCPGEMEMVVTIQTDKYPEDTSYTLTNDCEGSTFTPIEFAANPDAENALYDDTYCVPMGQYTFVLTDSWGDGLCCKYGDGFYNVTVDGVVEASGGEFTNDDAGANVPAFQKATFGSCPTGSPTMLPTASPSVRPTSFPSRAPTTPTPTSNLPVVASFDAPLGSPKCSAASPSCSSGALLEGKGGVGPETNDPNTLDDCPDGNSGTYLKDESIEMITVEAVGGGALQKGGQAKITAQVWAYSADNSAEFYRKVDLDSPWVYIGRAQAEAAGEQNLSSEEFILSNSELQAVRVQFGYKIDSGNRNACIGLDGDGKYADRDDLAFFVAP